jgi:hypothetical protein
MYDFTRKTITRKTIAHKTIARKTIYKNSHKNAHKITKRNKINEDEDEYIKRLLHKKTTRKKNGVNANANANDKYQSKQKYNNKTFKRKKGGENENIIDIIGSSNMSKITEKIKSILKTLDVYDENENENVQSFERELLLQKILDKKKDILINLIANNIRNNDYFNTGYFLMYLVSYDYNKKFNKSQSNIIYNNLLSLLKNDKDANYIVIENVNTIDYNTKLPTFNNEFNKIIVEKAIELFKKYIETNKENIKDTNKHSISLYYVSLYHISSVDEKNQVFKNYKLDFVNNFNSLYKKRYFIELSNSIKDIDEYCKDLSIKWDRLSSNIVLNIKEEITKIVKDKKEERDILNFIQLNEELKSYINNSYDNNDYFVLGCISMYLSFYSCIDDKDKENFIPELLTNIKNANVEYLIKYDYSTYFKCTKNALIIDAVLYFYAYLLFTGVTADANMKKEEVSIYFIYLFIFNSEDIDPSEKTRFINLYKNKKFNDINKKICVNNDLFHCEYLSTIFENFINKYQVEQKDVEQKDVEQKDVEQKDDVKQKTIPIINGIIKNTNKPILFYIISQQNSIIIVDENENENEGEGEDRKQIKNMKIAKNMLDIETTDGLTIQTEYDEMIETYVYSFYSIVLDEIYSRRRARDFINKKISYTNYVWNFGQNVGDVKIKDNKILLNGNRIGSHSNYYIIWDEEYKDLQGDPSIEFTQEEQKSIDNADAELNTIEYNPVLSQDQINMIRNGNVVPEEHFITEYFSNMEMSNNIERDDIIGKGKMSECNKLIESSSSSEHMFSYNRNLNTLYWKDNENDKYKDKIFIDDIKNDPNTNKIIIKTMDCDKDIEIQYNPEDIEKWNSFYDKCYQIVEKNKSELFLRKKIINILNENRENSPITYTQFIYTLNDKKDNVDTVPDEISNIKLNVSENRVGKGSQVEILWSEEYKAKYGKDPDYTKDEIEYFSINYKVPKWKSILSSSYLEEWRKTGASASDADADTSASASEADKVQKEEKEENKDEPENKEEDADASASASVSEADASASVSEADASASVSEADASASETDTSEADASEDDFEMIDDTDLKNPTTSISYTPYGFEIIVDFTKYLRKKL